MKVGLFTVTLSKPLLTVIKIVLSKNFAAIFEIFAKATTHVPQEVLYKQFCTNMEINYLTLQVLAKNTEKEILLISNTNW